MISRLSRDSCLCRFSRRLSSLASINSWTRAAAVVKPTDIPLWQAAQAQPKGHVGLAGAAVADGDHVFTALDVFTPGQFHHQGLVHRWDGREVEGVQAFDGRESGGADPPLHHALVAVDEFQLGEAQQVLGMVHTLGGALGCHLTVLHEKGGLVHLSFSPDGHRVTHASEQ